MGIHFNVGTCFAPMNFLQFILDNKSIPFWMIIVENEPKDEEEKAGGRMDIINHWPAEMRLTNLQNKLKGKKE